VRGKFYNPKTVERLASEVLVRYQRLTGKTLTPPISAEAILDTGIGNQYAYRGQRRKPCQGSPRLRLEGSESFQSTAGSAQEPRWRAARPFLDCRTSPSLLILAGSLPSLGFDELLPVRGRFDVASDRAKEANASRSLVRRSGQISGYLPGQHGEFVLVPRLVSCQRGYRLCARRGRAIVFQL